MKVLHVVAESPASFLQHVKEVTFIEKKPLQYCFILIFNITCRFCAERLSSLVRSLELPDIPDLSALERVCNFATIVSTYQKG